MSIKKGDGFPNLLGFVRHLSALNVLRLNQNEELPVSLGDFIRQPSSRPRSLAARNGPALTLEALVLNPIADLPPTGLLSLFSALHVLQLTSVKVNLLDIELPPSVTSVVIRYLDQKDVSCLDASTPLFRSGAQLISLEMTLQSTSSVVFLSYLPPKLQSFDFMLPIYQNTLIVADRTLPTSLTYLDLTAKIKDPDTLNLPTLVNLKTFVYSASIEDIDLPPALTSLIACMTNIPLTSLALFPKSLNALSISSVTFDIQDASLFFGLEHFTQPGLLQRVVEHYFPHVSDTSNLIFSVIGTFEAQLMLLNHESTIKALRTFDPFTQYVETPYQHSTDDNTNPDAYFTLSEQNDAIQINKLPPNVTSCTHVTRSPLVDGLQKRGLVLQVNLFPADSSDTGDYKFANEAALQVSRTSAFAYPSSLQTLHILRGEVIRDHTDSSKAYLYPFVDALPQLQVLHINGVDLSTSPMFLPQLPDSITDLELSSDAWDTNDPFELPAKPVLPNLRRFEVASALALHSVVDRLHELTKLRASSFLVNSDLVPPFNDDLEELDESTLLRHCAKYLIPPRLRYPKMEFSMSWDTEWFPKLPRKLKSLQLPDLTEWPLTPFLPQYSLPTTDVSADHPTIKLRGCPLPNALESLQLGLHSTALPIHQFLMILPATLTRLDLTLGYYVKSVDDVFIKALPRGLLHLAIESTCLLLEEPALAAHLPPGLLFLRLTSLDLRICHASAILGALPKTLLVLEAETFQEDPWAPGWMRKRRELLKTHLPKLVRLSGPESDLILSNVEE